MFMNAKLTQMTSTPHPWCKTQDAPVFPKPKKTANLAVAPGKVYSPIDPPPENKKSQFYLCKLEN